MQERAVGLDQNAWGNVLDSSFWLEFRPTSAESSASIPAGLWNPVMASRLRFGENSELAPRDGSRGPQDGRIGADDILTLLVAIAGGAEDVRMRGFRTRVSVTAALEAALEGVVPLPGEEVAVTECAGNDAGYFDYLTKGGRKPSRRNQQDMQKRAEMRV